MSKRIALFGGSFNPPHLGHYEIARRLARRKTIDEVWVLPVFRHPLRKRLAPFSRRLRLCKGFFKPLGSRVKVKDLEKRLGGVSWTIRLIRHLKRRHREDDFFLVLGGDSYRQRGAWKDFDSIREEVRLIIFPRGAASPIPNLSSTQIRRGMKK